MSASDRLLKLGAKIDELESTLELIRKADMRAIKMWQKAHPGHDHVWPDRGKMIFWLLERNKELENLNRAHVHMTKRVDGYPIDEYNNCAECGGGPEGSIPHDKSCKHYEAHGS